VVIIITFLFSDDLDIRNSVQSSINEPDHAAGASSNHTGNRESDSSKVDALTAVCFLTTNDLNKYICIIRQKYT
jgi:hypothetical protein